MNLAMSSIIGTYSDASARLGPGFGQAGFVSSGHFGNAGNLSWYEGADESTLVGGLVGLFPGMSA